MPSVLFPGASTLTGAVFRSIRKVHPKAKSEQVWIDLCKNDATAFRIFLEFYIVSSKKMQLTLGPEEYVMERAVKPARSGRP